MNRRVSFASPTALAGLTSRRDVARLSFASILTFLVITGTAKADDYSGTVDEITEKTITLDGVKYGLGGGGDRKVSIFQKGKQGGLPDWVVEPAQVKKYIKVGDKITGRKVFAGDGTGRDNIWTIMFQ